MILDHVKRPVELFDPSKKEHRKHYSNFLKTKTWGQCPIAFEVVGDQSNNNLAFAMQRLLTEYYIAKEFK